MTDHTRSIVIVSSSSWLLHISIKELRRRYVGTSENWCHFRPQWNISSLLDVMAGVPKVAPGLETPTDVALHRHPYALEIFFDTLVDFGAEGGELFEPNEELCLESKVVVGCPVHRSCDVEVVQTHNDSYDIIMIAISGLLPVV